MTAKQLTGSHAPDASQYVTLTDGAGNLAGNVELGDVAGTFTNATQTNSVTTPNIDSFGTVMISVHGTYGTASGVFEISDDGGTTWFGVQGSRTDSSVLESGYTSLTNTTRAWNIPVNGADAFRVRSTAVASGTVSVNLSISGPVTPTVSISAGVLTSQYPANSTPITASTTGTTGVVTATLAGVAGKTTYISGFVITADATALTTGTATVTGTVTGTLNFVQTVTAVTSGAAVLSIPFNPAIPASAVNTGIAVNSIAAGTGGVTAVSAWGYQL